jgi:L-ascorbate metabolism protein UlaG (beta-lactamase superfamily)
LLAAVTAAAEPPASRISTREDPSDPRLALQPGQVAIEYIAHACFRIHSPGGARLLIDPFASRVWIGYDFPPRLSADAVLITHPHYDHDAGVFIGRKPPWPPEVRVLRDPGSYTIKDVRITGIRGKHAEPYGKEFGQTNTIWLLQVAGLRVAHLGDNGPLTAANLRELGRVDILMMPIDAKHHLLREPEIRAIRAALHPRILVPMHYQLPDLEPSPDSPSDLGPIDPWLAGQQNVVRLDNSVAIFTAGSLLPGQHILVFRHSGKVQPLRPPKSPDSSLPPQPPFTHAGSARYPACFASCCEWKITRFCDAGRLGQFEA